MTQLTYSAEELLREHPGLEPHLIGDTRVHGGMLPDGTYQPPRALVRERALDAWTDALRARGRAPFPADASLLDGVRAVNPDQHRVLLRNGLGRWFWNQLTVTGKIEARGRLLADASFPDLQPVIVEDVSEMAVGHLGRGLLLAHGIDEGGQPELGIGGHDVMWFLARDLAFGDDTHPDVEPPENIARPEAGTRFMPELPEGIEGLLSLLANLLIIEFRAELGFAEAQAVLRTPGLFAGGDDRAALAAEVIERIRTDEAIHVRSLCLYLGEIESVTFRTLDGGTVAGRELIGRFWDGLVQWATVDQPKLNAERVRREVAEYIATHPDAARVQAEFDAAA
ncbi:MAG: hypothetical protein QNJ12_04470 [Ilumatobacter sp.]|uniref:hypothetical protein n=1 Tax=Ilumatobacter sp. TaxID=1967498 RepID=UPI00261A1EC8|nr:hypothetical protein [Ilumatobacter sp.]MDJ0768020.1 hypothetical protein [Ilumatobacter sp.]